MGQSKAPSNGQKPKGKGAMPKMGSQSNNKTYKTMDAYLKDLNKKVNGSLIIRKLRKRISLVLKTLPNIIKHHLNQYQHLMI